MRRWSLEEITELIEKRLKFGSQREFQLSYFFDRDVIRRIWLENDANPRFCSNACKSLLEQGFKENTKPIKAAFINAHPELVKGAMDSPVYSELEAINLNMVKRFPSVHLELKELFSDKEYEASNSLECLLEIQAKGSIPRTENGRALVIHRLARNDTDHKGNLIFTIESDVSTFFDKLIELLRGDVEALKIYFYNMFM